MLSNPDLHSPSVEDSPPGRVDPRFAGALKLFTVLTRAQSAVAKHAETDIARHGLTVGEFAVLDVLYHRGQLLLGTIGEKILASSGGITYLVDRLEGRGLVARHACPGDRRARYAALTPAGVEFMDRFFPVHARCIETATEALSPDEREILIHLLKKLGKGAVAASCTDPPTTLP
jgi:MarR family 2-MHQ and catechol resistance regulon transcriptional repressor